MAINTRFLPKPIDNLLNLFDIHPGVGSLRMNLEKRMTENAFTEAPSVRVGFLSEDELFRRRNRDIFGNLIRIAACCAKKPQHETNQ